MECVRLRVKDVDLDSGEILILDDKRSMFPRSLGWD